jgi:hypothetical protein
MPNNLGRAIDELFIIIDEESVLKTKAMADSFRAYFIAANNYEEGLNLY